MKGKGFFLIYLFNVIFIGFVFLIIFLTNSSAVMQFALDSLSWYSNDILKSIFQVMDNLEQYAIYLLTAFSFLMAIPVTAITCIPTKPKA